MSKSMRRALVPVVVTLGSGAAFGFLPASPAAAALPSECDSSGPQIVCTFAPPAGDGFVVTPFTVPSWVTSATFELRGGSGGTSRTFAQSGETVSSGEGLGGLGALVAAPGVVLTPGETLNLYVGGAGGDGGTSAPDGSPDGGVNGGGFGASSNSSGSSSEAAWAAAGGGGGGSFVYRTGVPIADDPLLAAGGGGGGLARSVAAIGLGCASSVPGAQPADSGTESANRGFGGGSASFAVAQTPTEESPQIPLQSCATAVGAGGGGRFGGSNAALNFQEGTPSAAGGGTSFLAPGVTGTIGTAPQRGNGYIRITFAKQAVAPPAAVPTCFGLPATIVGTGGDDRLIGTSGRDVIVGLGGNDIIRGKAGDDVICGGDGNDTIRGNAGKDRIDGGRGDDKINGDGGHDLIKGGAGKDLLSGEGGADALYGQAGDDNLRGGGGDDLLHGGAGTDVARGGRGDNTFSAVEIRVG